MMRGFTPNITQSSLESDGAFAVKRPAKRVAIIAAALVVVVALGTTVGVTSAYFTTYAAAKGSIPISLKEKTEITESFGSWTKHVTITNDGADGASREVFVRVKAFGPSTYPLVYSGSDEWVPEDDGYYYYSQPLDPGQATSQLDVRITDVPESESAEVGSNFNVVVVYETMPVLYDENGKAYADWSVILNDGNAEGGE